MFQAPYGEMLLFHGRIITLVHLCQHILFFQLLLPRQHDDRLEQTELFAALCLYLPIRRHAPDRAYHLSDSLWKLLLLLNATPFGIVLSVVLLTTTEEERIWILPHRTACFHRFFGTTINFFIPCSSR